MNEYSNNVLNELNELIPTKDFIYFTWAEIDNKEYFVGIHKIKYGSKYVYSVAIRELPGGKTIYLPIEDKYVKSLQDNLVDIISKTKENNKEGGE